MYVFIIVGRGNVVAITARYRLDGLEIETRWVEGGGARLSAPVQTGSEANPVCGTMGSGSLSQE